MSNKKDFSLKMLKNSQSTKLQKSQLSFLTGKTVINSEGKANQVFNDLNKTVMPRESVDLFGSAFIREQLNNLDTIFF